MPTLHTFFMVGYVDPRMEHGKRKRFVGECDQRQGLITGLLLFCRVQLLACCKQSPRLSRQTWTGRRKRLVAFVPLAHSEFVHVFFACLNHDPIRMIEAGSRLSPMRSSAELLDLFLEVEFETWHKCSMCYHETFDG